MKYVCYGNAKWDPEKWVEIENDTNWIKPRTGGLWSSPVDSEWGWIDWCKKEEFCTDLENSPYFTFSLSPDSKVYSIDTPADLHYFKYSHLNFDSKYSRFWRVEYKVVRSLFSLRLGL